MRHYTGERGRERDRSRKTAQRSPTFSTLLRRRGGPRSCCNGRQPRRDSSAEFIGPRFAIGRVEPRDLPRLLRSQGSDFRCRPGGRNTPVLIQHTHLTVIVAASLNTTADRVVGVTILLDVPRGLAGRDDCSPTSRRTGTDF